MHRNTLVITHGLSITSYQERINLVPAQHFAIAVVPAKFQSKRKQNKGLHF